MTAINTTGMRRLLGTLPQELYDEIYESTFAAPPGPHTLDQDWRFPVQLHISRHTRQQFAKTYFSSNFRVAIAERSIARTDGRDSMSRLCKVAKPRAKWLACLQVEHLSYIQGLDAVSEEDVDDSEAFYTALILKVHVRGLVEDLTGFEYDEAVGQGYHVARLAKGMRLLHLQ